MDIPCGGATQLLLLLLLLQLRALQLLPLLLLSCQVVGGSDKDLAACRISYGRRHHKHVWKGQALLTDIWPMRHAS